MNRLQRLAALLDIASTAVMFAANLVREAERSIHQVQERLGELEARTEESR